jgi:hypothetical protein
MRQAFTHFVRYSFCALAGAVLVAALLVIVLDASHFQRPSSPWWLLAPFPGALGFLLLRFGSGLCVRDDARADRLTTIGFGLFAVGGVMGWLVADHIYAYLRPSIYHRRLYDRGWWTLAIVLAGAFAMLLTGWLVRYRRARLALPAAWAGVFALLVAGWFNLIK